MNTPSEHTKWTNRTNTEQVSKQATAEPWIKPKSLIRSNRFDWNQKLSAHTQTVHTIMWVSRGKLETTNRFGSVHLPLIDSSHWLFLVIHLVILSTLLNFPFSFSHPAADLLTERFHRDSTHRANTHWIPAPRWKSSCLNANDARSIQNRNLPFCFLSASRIIFGLQSADWLSQFAAYPINSTLFSFFSLSSSWSCS